MKRLIYAALLILFLGCGKDEVKEIEKIKKVEQINDEEMALPTTNITTSMVRNILGESTNSVGALCTSLNINMWSKRKPVIDNRVEVPFADVGKSSGVAAEGTGWGLNVPGWIGDDNAITTYNRPFGGVNSPFRLGDFRGYNSNAKKPIILPIAPTSLKKKEILMLAIISGDGSDAVSFNDLFGGLRLGVNVYSGAQWIGSASSENIGGGSVTIDLTGLTASYLTFKFGLCDTYKAWDDPGGINMLYEIPRKIASENKNWISIPLETTAPPTNPNIKTFVILWNPISLVLEVRVESKVYTGLYTFQITRKYNQGLFYNDTISVTIANSLTTAIYNDVYLDEGEGYIATLRQGGALGTIVDTYEFTTFSATAGGL